MLLTWIFYISGSMAIIACDLKKGFDKISVNISVSVSLQVCESATLCRMATTSSMMREFLYLSLYICLPSWCLPEMYIIGSSQTWYARNSNFCLIFAVPKYA